MNGESYTTKSFTLRRRGELQFITTAGRLLNSIVDIACFAVPRVVRLVKRKVYDLRVWSDH